MNFVNSILNYINNIPVPQAVKVMAILSAIGGLALIGVAPILFAAGAVTGVMGAALGYGFLVGPFAIFWGLVCLVEGAAELLFAYGCWFIKPWALQLGIYIQIGNVVISFINWIGGSGGFFSFLLSVVISGLIVYYLQRPQVKQYFGVK